jgi:chromosome segregation ATPase
MSGHEKKGRAVRATGKSPIAAPPRVAVQGRSKADHHDDSASTKSTADGNGSENEDTDSDIKDKKIAELEKELATMEDEFERELTQLSHKLTNESETAIFWQQKHSTLNQTFLKTDTDLRLLRQEVNTFQQSREERDRDIKTRISSLMLDRDAFREAYNEAMGELRAKENMIKALQGQVWGLKSFVSTSSKMDEQVTDEAFGEYMQRLGNSLQNWVITNFRRAKIGNPDLVFCTNRD